MPSHTIMLPDPAAARASERARLGAIRGDAA